jgi:nucleoside-diphosphate-sugar epimerase
LNDLQLLSNSKSGEPEFKLEFIFETKEEFIPVEDFNNNFQDGTSWSPKYSFKRGIKETYDWYKKSEYWVSRVKNLEYLNYKILGL